MRILVAKVALRVLNRPWPYRHLSPIETGARRVYRSGATVAGPAHNEYELDGVRLEGDRARGPLAPVVDLSAVLRIAHDNRNRPAPRDAAAQTYRRERRRSGIEVAPCG